MASNYAALQFLTKAPNKKFVDSAVVSVFTNTDQLEDLSSALQISTEEASQLVSAIRILTRNYLLSVLVQGGGGGVQAQLADLLDRILAHHAPEWRDSLVSSQPSLPKVSMDYRIDIKSGSEAISRMSVPTVLVDLKVSKPPTNVAAEPEQQSVVFELNIETINTIMDSLKFVQGQLNSIK